MSPVRDGTRNVTRMSGVPISPGVHRNFARRSGLTHPRERDYSFESIMSSSTAKYARFGFAITIIVLALGYLAFTGVQQSKSYYVTISELKTMDASVYSKRLRVAGNGAPGSIKRRGTHLAFTLLEQDIPGAPKTVKSPDGKPWLLNVEYSGLDAPPDTFKDDSQALADGTFGRDGVFHAKQLQAKCASKYAPQPGATPAAEPGKSMSQNQSTPSNRISN